MRYIKFRMWNEADNKSYSKYFYNADQVMECLKQQCYFNEGKNGGYDHIQHGSVFEQYTGLKDIHGVEIYEGDIIQFTQRLFNTNPDNFTIKKREIKWYLAQGRWNVYDNVAPEFNIEVIGNIHKNSDLL